MSESVSQELLNLLERVAARDDDPDAKALAGVTLQLLHDHQPRQLVTAQIARSYWKYRQAGLPAHVAESMTAAIYGCDERTVRRKVHGK